jgi:serine/threonine protein phosphatase PrpC
MASYSNPEVLALRSRVAQLESALGSMSLSISKEFENEIQRRVAWMKTPGEMKSAAAADQVKTSTNGTSGMRRVKVISQKSVKGPYRPTNEDAEVVAVSPPSSGSGRWLFFSVFDGHGGSGASKMLSDPENGLAPFLFKKIDSILSAPPSSMPMMAGRPITRLVGSGGLGAGGLGKIATSAAAAVPSPEEMEVRLNLLYGSLADRLRQWFVEYDLTVLLPAAVNAATAECPIGMSGSTASVLIVAPDRYHIWLCTTGDSRIILAGPMGELLYGSKDQKPSDEAELKRIKAAGGHVATSAGDPTSRVMGILATSRAFADFSCHLKPRALSGSHSLESCETDILTAAPHIDAGILERGTPIVALLACDGFWDVVGNEEAASMLATREGWSYGPSGVADVTTPSIGDLLTGTALERGSKDNVSVLVVEIDP